MTQDELKLYEIYLATAEKVSDRRAGANAWMLSITSALTALQGLLKADSGLSAERVGALGWSIPAAGIIVAVAWLALLESYRQLNAAKFAVLGELEGDFRHRPLTREREVYKAAGRHAFTALEPIVPAAFLLLFAAQLIAG